MSREPGVGHPLRFTTIAHGGRQVLGPISSERVDALVERCRLAAGDHVLEPGCGKGGLLIRLLTRWPEATAEGFDRNPWFLADARAAAAGNGDVARRISFIETDAPGVLLADREVAMTLAIGATGTVGADQPAMVEALARATGPGGTVVFGDGFWLREPPASGLSAFGMARDELAEGLDGFAALGVGLGLEVLDVEIVDESEWDDYERSYVGQVRAWAASHPDDPEREAFLERATLMETSYREWRRDAFGFAIGRFRVPG